MTDKIARPVTGLELLQLLFVYLKLTNQVTWSWWGVMAPLWIPATLATIILTLRIAGALKAGHKLVRKPPIPKHQPVKA